MSDLGTLAAIAQRTGGRVVGDGSLRVERLVAIEDAEPGSLTFATDATYLRAALASRASAVLTDEALVAAQSYPKPLVAVASTRLAMAELLAALERRLWQSSPSDPETGTGPLAGGGGA